MNNIHAIFTDLDGTLLNDNKYEVVFGQPGILCYIYDDEHQKSENLQ